MLWIFSLKTFNAVCIFICFTWAFRSLLIYGNSAQEVSFLSHPSCNALLQVSRAALVIIMVMGWRWSWAVFCQKAVWNITLIMFCQPAKQQQLLLFALIAFIGCRIISSCSFIQLLNADFLWSSLETAFYKQHLQSHILQLSSVLYMWFSFTDSGELITHLISR